MTRFRPSVRSTSRFDASMRFVSSIPAAVKTAPFSRYLPEPPPLPEAKASCTRKRQCVSYVDWGAERTTRPRSRECSVEERKGRSVLPTPTSSHLSLPLRRGMAARRKTDAPAKFSPNRAPSLSKLVRRFCSALSDILPTDSSCALRVLFPSFGWSPNASSTAAAAVGEEVV